MDFIEVLFGLSPDNGSGATEAAILIVAIGVALGIAIVIAKRLKRR